MDLGKKIREIEVVEQPQVLPAPHEPAPQPQQVPVPV